MKGGYKKIQVGRLSAVRKGEHVAIDSKPLEVKLEKQVDFITEAIRESEEVVVREPQTESVMADNVKVKHQMAQDLYDMGLSWKSIERLLNIKRP